MFTKLVKQMKSEMGRDVGKDEKQDHSPAASQKGSGTAGARGPEM